MIRTASYHNNIIIHKEMRFPVNTVASTFSTERGAAQKPQVVYIASY